MMKVTCEEARLQIGADPRASSTVLRVHVAECRDCRNYQCDMAALEADLRWALALGPPPLAHAAPKKIPAKQRPATQRPVMGTRAWAMAASALIAFLAGLLLWVARAPESLASEIEEHLDKEPQSWTGSKVIPPAAIDAVMRRAHVQLALGQDKVVFALTCPVHGHQVPHLVVRTAQGPVAVLILPDEPVKAPSSFHVGNLTGMLFPAPRGSIAVLTQQATLSLDVALELRSELRWLT